MKSHASHLHKIYAIAMYKIKTLGFVLVTIVLLSKEKRKQSESLTYRKNCVTVVLQL